MDFVDSAIRIAFALLGIACFVLLVFTDLAFSIAESKTRKQIGAAWGLILALFAVQLVLSGQEAPVILTALGVLGLSFGATGFAIFALRPMVYLRPKGLTRISKHEYRLDEHGIIIRTYGLGGPTARRWDRPRLSIFNDGHQPLILETATVTAAGRTYAPRLSHKGKGPPVVVDPKASVPLKLRLDFDRPLPEAYGREAQVVLHFRVDSQSRELSIDFEAEPSDSREDR